MTIEDLEDRAQEAITEEEPLAVAVAKQKGRRFSDVKQASWFHVAVMAELASTRREYRHLLAEVQAL